MSFVGSNVTLSEIQKSLPMNQALLQNAATAPVSLTDAQKVLSLNPALITPQQIASSAHSATLSLPDAQQQKPMTLTPAILPISLTSKTQTTSSSSVLSQGTPIRFFAPLAPSMMASLGNGQTHLMPTVLQLASSGPVAVLQNLVQAGPHPLLAQPIIVMTTPSPVVSISSTNASLAGTKVATVTTSSISEARNQ